MTTLSMPEAVTDRLTELAPRLPDIAALIQNDETSWTLGFEDDTAILVEWAEAPTRLVLSSEIGMPLPERRAEILDSLLSYALMWRESGGVKVGQGDIENGLVLLYEWHVDVFDADQLQDALENFATLARMWGAYLAHDETEARHPMQRPDAALLRI
ncbi:type III secretion system chaperone [Variovorax paradoxus]|nr:type III secretion system chaperone [Variovorax paradoxus]